MLVYKAPKKVHCIWYNSSVKNEKEVQELKTKGAINMIEETTPDFTEKTFEDAVPEYSFSVNGTQIVVRVKPIVGADGYEIYQSEKKHSGYSLAVESSSPVVDFYVPDGKSYYYKVRAFHGVDAERITTDYSEPQYVDLVTASKNRDKRIENFFNSLKEIGEVLSFEDLDVAIESLKVAGLEVREKEARRKLEEEAEKKKKEIEAQNKRRQAAVRRARQNASARNRYADPLLRLCQPRRARDAGVAISQISALRLTFLSFFRIIKTHPSGSKVETKRAIDSRNL